MLSHSSFRRKLLAWYDASHRKLPWRETRDPYAIWISEVMLQQTRVAAVIPYYQRFLERFPTIDALAAAPEQELLAAWSGLGYYSRARNLQKAARQMNGSFPRDYDAIRALAGVGDYTAAAVASIAFDLPHAAVDGNVLRVMARITNDAGDIRSTATRSRLAQTAAALLDRRQPGKYNQALMELGATICLPKRPQCLICPVRDYCQAALHGTQNQLPVKLGKKPPVRAVRTLLIVCKKGTLLLWQRKNDARMMAGMWELPEPEHLPHTAIGLMGTFKHSITNHQYTFQVMAGRIARIPRGSAAVWVSREELAALPLTTAARKALKIAAVLLD